MLYTIQGVSYRTRLSEVPQRSIAACLAEVLIICDFLTKELGAAKAGAARAPMVRTFAKKDDILNGKSDKKG